MATKYFHWDPINDCVTHETDGSGNTIAMYNHEPGQFGPLISETRSGRTYTHHYDALGSTTALTDDTGSLSDAFTFDGWGSQVGRTGTTPTPYQWVGRIGYYFDSTTNAYYVRARAFQPKTASWSSVDPLSVALGAYLYAWNRPLRHIDPSGLVCCCCIPQDISVDPRTIVIDLPNPQENIAAGQRLGLRFRVHMNLKLQEDANLAVSKRCRVDWFECGEVRANLGQRANQWFHVNRGPNGGPPEDVGNNWNEQLDSCPGNFAAYWQDDPSIPNAERAELRLNLAVRVAGGEGCSDVVLIKKFSITTEIQASDINIIRNTRFIPDHPPRVNEWLNEDIPLCGDEYLVTFMNSATL
jgi:RHS repeat-associated protein